MRSNCQQEIIRHQRREIMQSQALQELIRHQAEVVTVVAVGTVVVAVLEVADQVHQTTDLDK